MKQFVIGSYSVNVLKESYSNHSIIDNKCKYDFEYVDDNGFICPTLIGIKIFKNDTPLKSALIGAHGGGTGIHETSLICESDRIIICCSDTIFSLSIPSLSMLWKTKADPATCFEIFKYKNDYIVHGELEITRLGNDGRIIWQQGGADIFTTLNSSKDDFVINENYILATDWENRKYKFDFDGNQIQPIS